MTWLLYLAAFLVICIVWFLITRIWVALVDTIIAALKKLFRSDKNDAAGSWHTLDEIGEKDGKDDTIDGRG